jgi:ATP synthase protein I
VNGLGRTGAYLALFSEIGFILLVSILLGVLVGKWVDDRLGTLPVFALIGFFLGLMTGWVGVFRLITRFLARFDRPDSG